MTEPDARQVTNATVELITRHRSIRRYLPDPIPEAAVQAILASAQAAPSSSHKQAFSVISVTNPATKRRLAAVADDQEWVEECALFLVWCADLHRIRVALSRLDAPMAYDNIEEFIIATVDVTLAAANALVAAESLGLGGVLIGGLRNDPATVTALLDLPQLVYPAYGMCLGYPAEDPWLKPRLPVDAVHHRERYRSDDLPAFLDAYDETTRAYYLARTDGGRDTTWSREMANKYRVSQRPHMREYLEGQGFRFD